jgi:hypothetical protein
VEASETERFSRKRLFLTRAANLSTTGVQDIDKRRVACLPTSVSHCPARRFSVFCWEPKHDR